MLRRIIYHPETFAVSKFAIVGILGFLVDAGILVFGVYVLGLDPIVTRIFSVTTSVLVTWAINRVWTFEIRKQESAWLELGRYLVGRSVGAACNVAIFAVAINWLPYPLNTPIWATPFSSASTVLINYAMVRLLVYNPKSIGPPDAGDRRG